MAQPEKTNDRHYILQSLSRYWRKNSALLDNLPIPHADRPQVESLPPVLTWVDLPEWGAVWGINGKIVVPLWSVLQGGQEEWQRTDWLGASFWFLNCFAEQAYEEINGPVHSYSFRLKGWDKSLWQYAWVNRIALFLRCWVSMVHGRKADELLGPLPKYEITLTHDVDAVAKTLMIRSKQSAFHLLNGLRTCVRGRIQKGSVRLLKACRFFCSGDDYWCFDKIMQMEDAAGVRSHFNFFGGLAQQRRTIKEHIFDPSYDIFHPVIKRHIKCLHAGGWTIGLHPSFLSWENSLRIREEKFRVEQSLGEAVTVCRQHWLRFSWQKTWKAQQEAGILFDTTLGFNDCSGFRNSAALSFSPWCQGDSTPLNIQALPMVLMDSHLYDYGDFDEETRCREIDRWLEEIRFVRGQASVIWHQRVFSDDYGWSDGYEYLLERLR